MRIALLVIVLSFVLPAVAAANKDDPFRATDFPLPRFVSLKSDKVYVRSGPSTNYPIEWVFRREGLPVEIIQEFEVWRKIRDHEGQQGWVHKLLLSGKRTAIVIPQEEDVGSVIEMREGFTDSARVTAIVEPMVVAGVDRCVEDYCRIDAGAYRGWVQRKFLFGIYENEELH